MTPRDPIVRASELSQYAFCARAWWLGRVKGYRSSNLAAMERGEARHRAHGRTVVGYHRLRWLALALLSLAAVLIVAWLLLGLVG
jgi:CRISPR/Cas system-associated exonuclease Cas4 (RecB family)